MIPAAEVSKLSTGSDSARGIGVKSVSLEIQTPHLLFRREADPRHLSESVTFGSHIMEAACASLRLRRLVGRAWLVSSSRRLSSSFGRSSGHSHNLHRPWPGSRGAVAYVAAAEPQSVTGSAGKAGHGREASPADWPARGAKSRTFRP